MKSFYLGLKLGMSLLSVILLSNVGNYWGKSVFARAIVDILPDSIRGSNILQLCQPITVRVVKTNSAGSGVIIGRVGYIYSVLTNWHFVESSIPCILTAYDNQHQFIDPPQHLGDADLAVVQFYSDLEYPLAKIASQIPQIGDTVYAAGFPLIIGDNENTLDLGNKAFRMTQGKISMIPFKSLPQGYRLGYTNYTKPGMSGSPVFDAQGLLVGIHGRGKYRDPAFGVYLFEDGSEPSPQQLEQMIESSWGIPIGVYQEAMGF